MVTTFEVDTFDRTVKVYRVPRFWMRPRFKRSPVSVRFIESQYAAACRRARRCRLERQDAARIGVLSDGLVLRRQVSK